MKNYKSLSVYKDREVYIFGASGGGEIVKDYLECHDVPIRAFVDSNEEKWGTSFLGYEVISPKKLQEEAKVNRNVLVQIASSYENEIRDELKKMNITEYISFSAFFMMKNRKVFELFQQDKEFYEYYLEHIVSSLNTTKNLWNQYFDKVTMNQKIDSAVALCIPPKTGNFTVSGAFSQNAYDSMLCVETWHTSFYLPKFFEMVNVLHNKIITAVREPISQNISLLFQIGDGEGYLIDQPEYWENDYFKLLQKVECMDSGSVVADCIFQRTIHSDKKTMLIQNFFEEQFKKRLGVDLLAEPFDTKRGFSIVEQNGFEIFIFQLEKFDLIQKELLAFAGLDSEIEFKRANDAVDKYYAPLYQEVKETISITRRYFEDSFNNPYIKHFYSEEDIKKFRMKWEKHVVEEKKI